MKDLATISAKIDQWQEADSTSPGTGFEGRNGMTSDAMDYQQQQAQRKSNAERYNEDLKRQAKLGSINHQVTWCYYRMWLVVYDS